MVMLFAPCLLFLVVLVQETRAACQLGDDVIKLTSWRGQLSSPGFGQGQYPSDQQCRWDIEVSQGSRVKVSFVNFDLEDGYYQDASPSIGKLTCNDIVKVVDGDGQSVLFQGCQSEGQGRTFNSTGNRLSVYFLSDEGAEKSGFNATYEGVCRDTLSQSGFLESPGYPDPPPEGVGCQWQVTSSQNEILYIRPYEQDVAHVLPDCKSAVLTWKTTGSGNGVQARENELCRTNSKVVSQSDITLTYEPQSTNRWTGRLFMNYSTQSGCEQYCEHGFSCFDSKTMHVSDYQCLCEPPYELGHNCEIYTNPCLAHNCSGAGVCTPVPDSVQFNCHCGALYSGQRCEVKLPDPCESVTCLHGGTCRADEETGEVTCLCLPDYTGTRCSIAVGEGYCRAEVDHNPGSKMSWADTLADHHDNQPCPVGVRGQAQRYCMGDARSPTGAVWKRPDLSECVSPQFYNITIKAQALRQSGVGGDLLYNVTRQLDDVTSQLVTSGGEVYPGDLMSASDVLADISKGVMTASSVHYDPPGLAQHFTSSISNILHPDTLHVWSNARAYLVENKVASILTSAQRFAENLVERQRGQNVISGVTSSGDISSTTLLSSSAEYVELVVSEWGKENTTWTPLFPALWPSAGSTSSSSVPGDGSSMIVPSTGASITLPSELLDIARADGSDRMVRVYTGRFSSIGPLLSLKEDRYTRPEEVPVHRVVNSDVLSAEVLDLPPSAFSSLSMPVVLTFPLTDPHKGDDLDKYCVFMNMSASGPDDRWLREGCYRFQSNDTHVTCYCYHLTNFAVLLDVYDQADKLDKANSAALSYITYIGGSLSILSCVVVIIVFEYFRLRSDRVRIHEQLAASITAVQVLFFVGVAYSTDEDQSSSPQWGCKAVSILLHYSLTALFCWMLVEGIHIYLQLVRVFKQPSHLTKYCAIGWGVPLLVVGISVGVFFDKYGEHNQCWLNHEVLLVCFVPTVSLVVCVNVVILVLVVRIMLRSLQSTAKANAQNTGTIRSSVKACAVLLPLLGVTWVLAFLAVDSGYQRVTVYVFTYLFTITNSCQGLLFFLFHCLLNVDVHNAYERKYRQRKRALSSLETQTRKNSETSTYLTDSSSRRKSTTKTMLSDMSVLSPRRPSVVHNRFLMFDHPPPHPLHHPHHPDCEDDCDTNPAPTGTNPDPRGDCCDGLPDGLCDDLQASDKEIIWRRSSVNHDQDHSHFATSAFPGSPGYPSSPSRDVSAFVTSMHNVLDSPTRNSVRFSED